MGFDLIFYFSPLNICMKVNGLTSNYYQLIQAYWRMHASVEWMSNFLYYGLSSLRCQVITCTNADLLSNEPLETFFHEFDKYAVLLALNGSMYKSG